MFPVQLAKSSILWNPLIYICMNKSVRKTHYVLSPFLLGFSVPAELPEITSSLFLKPLLLQGPCQYISSAGPQSPRRPGGHLRNHTFKKIIQTKVERLKSTFSDMIPLLVF